MSDSTGAVKIRRLRAEDAAELVSLCRERGFVGFHHYPTTAHPVMQKLAVSGGGVESGVMLGYIPAGTDYRELPDGTSGRLAVVVVYQPLASAPPRRVHPPQRYAATFAQAWREARLEREIVAPATSIEIAQTQASASVDMRRGLLRVSVTELGRDVCERVEALGRDVLRLQRLRDPSPEFLQPRLVTEGGQRLLALITADTPA